MHPFSCGYSSPETLLQVAHYTHYAFIILGGEWKENSGKIAFLTCSLSRHAFDAYNGQKHL